MFDEKTCQALKWYVYLLVNPETSQPFYVGKGENNRVFQHVENVREGKSRSEPKNEMIKSILDRGEEVIHYIVRHGMDEKTALSVEASLIDAFNLFDATKLTNLVNGHDVEHGLMSDVEISNKYSATCIPPLRSDSIVININKLYHRGISEDGIYEATRHWWPIRQDKVNTIRYFLSEYQGLIVGVFEVDEENGVEFEDVDYTPGTEAAKSGKKRRRYGFRGHVAPNDVQELYYGKCLPIKAKRFPLLYPDKVNAAIPK